MTVPLFVNGQNVGPLDGPPQDDGADQGELVTLSCDAGCAETFTGPRHGRNSAPFLLGKHRWSVHKVKSTRAKKAAAGATRKAGAPSAEAHQESPLAAAVRSTAVEAGAGRRSGVPSGEDLGNGLGRGLALVSLSVTSWVVESDPNIPETPEGHAERSQMIDYLMIQPETARGIMAPIGRLLAPTQLNRKYGRAAVDNVDVVASISDLAMVAYHWRQYLRMRRAQLAPQPAAGYPPPAAVGLAPVVPFGPLTPTEAPTGRVLSAEDVARLQSRGDTNG